MLALTATAIASTPRTGTYKATTSQCGTTSGPHPCYTFTIKVAKGRCFVLGKRGTHPGYCVSFSAKDNAALVFADVTCPDARTFQSQIDGPGIPLLLSSSGSVRFSANAYVSEAGKELVVGVEKVSLAIKGSHISGTLTRLAQENLGLEPPACTTGTVTFTAKRL